MSEYLIKVSGCDASTRVIVELDETELATIERLAAAVKAQSTGSCEPTFKVIPLADADEDDLDEARRDDMCACGHTRGDHSNADACYSIDDTGRGCNCRAFTTREGS